MADTPPLVDAGWLAGNIGRDDVRVVDASWHMPVPGGGAAEFAKAHMGALASRITAWASRDGAAEFAKAHIPGAAFFSIDAIADPDSSLPHMVPDADAFGEAAGRLGISNDDHVVVYATGGVGTAPRAWWMFRLFGHERVSVLDGGLRAWTAAGGAVETGKAAPQPRTFRARLRPELVRSFGAVRANLDSKGERVLDARSKGRFRGAESEPRAGLQGGRIPGSLNLPYDQLLEKGAMRPAEDLARLFREAGVENEGPLILSCGSGISACVLGLGLAIVGRDDWSVYDGSWTEWGGHDDAPVETG